MLTRGTNKTIVKRGGIEEKSCRNPDKESALAKSSQKKTPPRIQFRSFDLDSGLDAFNPESISFKNQPPKIIVVKTKEI
jgi:hypothetical protein